MSGRLHPVLWICALGALAGTLLISSSAGAQIDPRGQQLEGSLSVLVDAYRRGSVDRAVDDLAKLAGEKRHEAAAESWCGRARRAGERAELEGALMLYTEAVMRAWAREDVFPDRLANAYAPTLLRLLDALKAIDRRSKFLRGWYLLWESVHQTYIGRPMLRTLDFLADALSAFPDDAEIQLAAGARWELTWSVLFDNPRVDPRRPRPVVAAALARARDHLRRSVALDGSDLEARLRLIRVSLESNDVAGAAKTFADGRWVSNEPAFAYLRHLFEGAIRERQGDYRAAAQAYDAAIPQMAQAQSARIARSHLAHLTGARAEAAAFALDATSNAAKQNDPWWVYTRGLAWRVGGYLDRQREMVRR
jgi:hypothetical protein